MKLLFTALAIAVLIFEPLMAQYNGKPQYDVLVRQFPDTFGTYRMELYPTIAPLHTLNFDTLAQQGFYDSLAFHRVVPNFVVQGGDPNSKTGPTSTWGFGAPWQQTVPAEFNPIAHNRSIIGAARGTNINSATSQFYINTANNANLNGNYTAYGKVISGMNVVDSIESAPRDANDLPLNKIDMFVQYVGIDTTAPSQAPILLTPADGATDLFGNVNFSWSAVTTGDFILYRIQFSKLQDFSVIDWEADLNTNVTNYNPMSVLEQGFQTYYWRVMTNNGGRLTASSTRSFTTYISPPDLQLPLDLSTAVQRNPTLEWTQVTGATEYHVVVSTIPLLTVPSFNVVDTFSTLPTIRTQILDQNKKYYWGVSSSLNGVPGAFSDMWEFTTDTTVSNLAAFEIEEIQIYPNPSDGHFTIIGGLIHENSRINVFNLEAKLVFSQSIGSDPTLMDLSQLPQGVYVYEVIQNNQLRRGKIQIQ